MLGLVAACFLFSSFSPAYGDDFYVITGTHKGQSEAQASAAMSGGWVLRTDLYPKRTPKLFAVVHGPFASQGLAKKRLKELSEGGSSEGYVKNAGDMDLNALATDKKLTPQLIAVLLGEIKIAVKDAPGGSHPCEPQESHAQFTFRYTTVAQQWNGKEQRALNRLEVVSLEMGALWRIVETGEIVRMRVCGE